MTGSGTTPVILDTSGSEPGDILSVYASYQEPGGDKREVSKIVTVTEGTALPFGIYVDITPIEQTGLNEFKWHVEASVSGWAANLPGVTFTWTRDGSVVASGLSTSWNFIGAPGYEYVQADAVDTEGNMGSALQYVPYRAPAEGEPPAGYYKWVNEGVRFLNSTGYEAATLVPGRGLIVITHGLWSSGSSWWVRQLAQAIEGELSGPSAPNVVIFDWGDRGSTPREYYSYEETVEELASEGGFMPSLMSGVLSSDIIAGLFDLREIRPVALQVGRNILARWIREQQQAQLISTDTTIHLIGHSAGGFVVGECYRKLQNEFNIQRVTMLDTPFIPDELMVGGGPAIIDRYVSSDFGFYTPDVDLFTFGIDPFFIWANQPVWYNPIWEKQESAFYHRLDIYNGSGSVFDEHGYSHEWYTDSVVSVPQGTEGFQRSPFMNSPTAPLTVEAFTANFSATAESPASSEPVVEWSTFGNVSGGSGAPFVLSESGNAGIFKSMTLPADAGDLTFEYQFTGLGDGEHLVMYIEGKSPMYISSPTPTNIGASEQATISIGRLSGETVTFVIKLVAGGNAETSVSISNIQITHEDDFDGDGVLTADELLYGTDPRYADTDGDLIDDATEINGGITDPTLFDTDGDGVDDGAELEAGTDPTDPLSRLNVTSVGFGGEGFVMDWSSVSDRTYRVLKSHDLGFGSYDVIGREIPGEPPENSYSDPSADPAAEGPTFYRVEVE
ncbi:MAG: alpha/beta fold hydrolase [Oceanipulchritudo sp.]